MTRRQEEYQMIANHPGRMSRETHAASCFMDQPHHPRSNHYLGMVSVCLIYSHSYSPSPPSPSSTPPTALRPFSHVLVISVLEQVDPENTQTVPCQSHAIPS